MNGDRLFGVVRKHLGLNVLKIHPRVRQRLYQPRATVRNCDGSCCSHGTTVSIRERDAIMARRATVAAFMTSRARRRPERWFGKRVSVDDDFTAGRTLTTSVVDGRCVFYRKDGLCALQVAGQKKLANPYALKPSVCLLWPLCVYSKTIDIGVASFTNHPACCAPRRAGSRTVLDVIGPDESLIRTMSRKGRSRGGGPPPKA
jgi:hypothetical protein